MPSDYVVIDYLRKSDEDKHGQVQSIPKQKDWAINRAQQDGETIDLFFQDTKTAKEPGRTGFAEMMAFIEKSPKPVKLYVWKTSRLARNGIDEGAIKYAISRRKIAHIITRDRSYDEYTNHILLGVDFGEATQFSIDLSKDVKEGMNQKVEKGYRPNRTPNGWLSDPLADKGNRRILVDKDRFPVLQKEIRKILDSKGVYRVADSLRYLDSIGFTNKKGGVIKYPTLSSFFKNPFICGQFQWHGVWHEGKHKPMITPLEFETLQVYVTGGRSRHRKHTNAYNGMIRCAECHCWVTTEPPKIKRSKNGKTHVYNYMRCTKSKGKCSQKCIRIEKLELQVSKVLSSVQVDREMLNYCSKAIKRDLQQNKADQMRQRSLIQKRYDENEVKISNLTEKYSLGKIDDDVYTQMIDQFKKRRHGIHNQLLSFGNNVERSINELGNDFKKVLNVANQFENGSIQEKKEILQNLQSNLWLVDGNLLIDLKPSFLILSQRNRLQTVIEPQKNRSHKGLSGFPGSKIQRWCTISALIRIHLKVRNWLELNEIVY